MLFLLACSRISKVKRWRETVRLEWKCNAMSPFLTSSCIPYQFLGSPRDFFPGSLWPHASSSTFITHPGGYCISREYPLTTLRSSGVQWALWTTADAWLASGDGSHSSAQLRPRKLVSYSHYSTSLPPLLMTQRANVSIVACVFVFWLTQPVVYNLKIWLPRTEYSS